MIAPCQGEPGWLSRLLAWASFTPPVLPAVPSCAIAAVIHATPPIFRLPFPEPRSPHFPTCSLMLAVAHTTKPSICYTCVHSCCCALASSQQPPNTQCMNVSCSGSSSRAGGHSGEADNRVGRQQRFLQGTALSAAAASPAAAEGGRHLCRRTRWSRLLGAEKQDQPARRYCSATVKSVRRVNTSSRRPPCSALRLRSPCACAWTLAPRMPRGITSECAIRTEGCVGDE